MQITKTTVTKLTITGAYMLDPITAIVEDNAPRKGKIIIECYGQSWSACWGGMGYHTMADFFCSMDEHYIARNLARDLSSTKYSSEGAQDHARAQVIADRRALDLSRDEARGLFTSINDNFCDSDTPHGNARLFQQVYGDDWWTRLPDSPNPDYNYLCRIIKAVQAAFRQIAEKEAVAA